MHYSLAMNAYMLHKWQWFSSQKQLTQLKVLTRLCCKHFPPCFSILAQRRLHHQCDFVGKIKQSCEYNGQHHKS